MMESQPPPSWEMSELEHRLLDAARNDRVPHVLGARMAEGLGVQLTASAAVTSASATSSALGTLPFAKLALWGVLSVVLVAVTSWGSRTPVQKTRSAERSRPAQVDAPAVVIEPPATDREEQKEAPQLQHAAEPVRAARALAPSDDAALLAEIALLDQARNALRAHASERALQLLDRHTRRFAPARLAPEAAALRIEALVQSGAPAQAQTLAHQFMSAHPSHPLSAQVAKLTASK